LYLAAIALSLLGWYADWSSLQAQLAADPRTVRVGWMLPVMLVLSIAVPLLLWFFTARRASVVAKWIVTMLAAVAVIRSLFDLPVVLRGAMEVASFAIGLATTIVSIAAAAMLFRADARGWFNQGEEVE
jgi:peptidoglycan/LPS O-acetylase OafA/YrhL